MRHPDDSKRASAYDIGHAVAACLQAEAAQVPDIRPDNPPVPRGLIPPAVRVHRVDQDDEWLPPYARRFTSHPLVRPGR